ncbi:MAG: cytochrome c oxidase assembly protein [Actinobacteria bacterium]|nr:cytochrome c oxidase assembly protein [Actinomycetota bacterium]MCL6095853.1 cytochrome c oxidase assembly protein [Actinomycetota bacterium]
MPQIQHLPPFGFRAVWEVLTTFSTGPWAILTFLAELLAIGWYFGRVKALENRGRRWPRRRMIAFVFGVLFLVIAWQTGVPIYAQSVFTVHVIQHVALMLAAPICFAMSAPVTLAMQTMSRQNKTTLIRALKSRPMRVLTNPVVAGVGNYGIMYWFFLDKGIVVSMAHPDLMDFVNICFLLFGSLVWWPVASIDYIGRKRYPYAGRIGIAMVGMPLDSFLAIALLGGAARQSIAPQMYSLASVQTGAAVFWILVGTFSMVGVVPATLQWMHQEERIGQRYDRLMDKVIGEKDGLDVESMSKGNLVVVGPDGRFMIVGSDSGIADMEDTETSPGAGLDMATGPGFNGATPIITPKADR